MSSDISPDLNVVVSTIVIVPSSFTGLGVFSGIFPSEDKRLGVLTGSGVLTSLVLSGFAYSVFSFRELPFLFMVGILSPSTMADPVLVRMFEFKSAMAPSMSVLSFLRRHGVGTPTTSSPATTVDPILGPDLLVVISSFVTSPPATVTVYSAKWSSVSGVSLSAKHDNVSAATTPERGASGFFSALFVDPSIVARRFSFMRYALFGYFSRHALCDRR